MLLGRGMYSSPSSMRLLSSRESCSPVVLGEEEVLHVVFLVVGGPVVAETHPANPVVDEGLVVVEVQRRDHRHFQLTLVEDLLAAVTFEVFGLKHLLLLPRGIPLDHVTVLPEVLQQRARPLEPRRLVGVFSISVLLLRQPLELGLLRELVDECLGYLFVSILSECFGVILGRGPSDGPRVLVEVALELLHLVLALFVVVGGHFVADDACAFDVVFDGS